MARLDRYGNPIGREIQKPNFNEPKWKESGISKEYNDIWKNRIKNRGQYPNPNELPQIIQQMKDTKQIINDFYQGKINFTEQFLDKVSYTYKGNFRPFGKLYPTGISTMSNVNKGITYNDFLVHYQRNLSPVRVEDIQQIGIDEDVSEPELMLVSNIRNINLYRILFDNVKKQKYITATHLNEPFNITDVEYYESLPNDYLVEDGNLTPKTAIGSRMYIDTVEIDSSESGFSKSGQSDPRAEKVVTKEITTKTVIQETKGSPKEAKIVGGQQNQVTNIIRDIKNNKIIVPNWFKSNVVLFYEQGKIDDNTFLTSFNYIIGQKDVDLSSDFELIPKAYGQEIEDLSTQERVDLALSPTEPIISEPDMTTSNNMVNQVFDKWQLFEGKIIGSITYNATKNFNSNYYYNFKSNSGATLSSIVQIKDIDQVVIKTKINKLKFSANESDETINFEESIPDDLTDVIIESYVWLSMENPKAFSNVQVISFNIKKPYKPKKEDTLLGVIKGVFIAGLALTLLSSSNSK